MKPFLIISFIYLEIQFYEICKCTSATTVRYSGKALTDTLIKYKQKQWLARTAVLHSGERFRTECCNN